MKALCKDFNLCCSLRIVIFISSSDHDCITDKIWKRIFVKTMYFCQNIELISMKLITKLLFSIKNYQKLSKIKNMSSATNIFFNQKWLMRIKKKKLNWCFKNLDQKFQKLLIDFLNVTLKKKAQQLQKLFKK